MTRTHETLDFLYSMLAAGRALLVGLCDPKDQALVGAGYFQHTRDEAMYSAAAYNRELFDKPLSHVVQ